MNRPIRGLIESTTSRIPRGPFGFLGKGNAAGAAGFVTVGLIRKLTPISGINIGYNIQSRSTEIEDGVEVHTFEINSASKDVARFVARLNSAPSTADFVLRDTEVISIEPLVERSTVNTWEVVVELEDRPTVEKIEDGMAGDSSSEEGV